VKSFCVWIATFFGIGRIPFAPGTWASLAALPFFWFLVPRPPIHILTLVLLFIVGIPLCTRAEKDMGETDPSSIVLDEVLGMGVALVGVPRETPYILMAFILFRLFDIWKPYPIRTIQKLPGGWGIMVDDLLAGLYALGWVHIGSFLVQSIK